MEQEQTKLKKVTFYDKDNVVRIRFMKSNRWEDLYMYETHDDNEVRRTLKGINYADRKEITNMLMPDNGWRKMSDKGPDKFFIREAIAAIHYCFKDDEIVNELIEEARPQWENNPYEPIPNPIPMPEYRN